MAGGLALFFCEAFSESFVAHVQVSGNVVVIDGCVELVDELFCGR